MDLTSLSLPMAETIGDRFLSLNQKLSSIHLPKVEKMGDAFLSHNQKLKHLSLPSVREVGVDCICRNETVASISMPKLERLGVGYPLWDSNSSQTHLYKGVNKMTYKRKTRDVFEIQGNYGHGHGYETVTTELTWKDAMSTIHTYKENEPGIPFRIKKVRERIEESP